MTVIASMFFWIAAFHCFLTVSKTDDYSLYVGYWQRETVDIAAAAAGKKDGNYCVGWDENSKSNWFDGLWRFGKSLSVLGAMVSAVLFITAFYLIVYKVQTNFLSGMFFASVFVGLCSLLFLTSLASSVCEIHSCTLGPGGYIAILDFFLWMGTAHIANKLKALSQEPEYAYEDSAPAANNEKLPQITANGEKDVEEVEGVTTLTTYDEEGSKKRADNV
jgi:hypothetical protein